LIAARLGTRNYQIDQLVAAGKTDEALELLNALIGESPTEATLFAKRAEVHEKLEQWERAADDWGKADELAADKTIRYGASIIPYMEHRARINGRLKHYDKQIEDWTALLQPERLPDHYSILSARGGTYDTLRQWDKALPDYNKAIEVAPPNWQAFLLNRRAIHFALQAKWKQATEDYAAAAAHSVQTGTVKSWTFSRNSALTHLAAGDAQGYRQQAAEMFNRHGGKMNLLQARRLVQVFTLAPDMITDANRDRLLKAVDVVQKSDEQFGSRFKASVHYRLGEFDEAAQLFADNNGPGVELGFLAAMAKFKAGDEEQARKFLQSPNRWMQTARDKDPNSALPKDGGWQKWAMLLTLKREAEALIGVKAAAAE
jgi:tetratricopeptide (TPR) repeat protein